jgi:2-amino-4-hydroxy-6-hydroxymethyldihydropteridine diphosphokinase
MEHVAYLSLGTNLGDKEHNIVEAYERIEHSVGLIVRKSSYHRSAPWGFSSQNEFLNTAVRCSTTLSPRQLMEATQRIESEMGRTVKSRNGDYHDRIIDIDILLYDDMTVSDPDLCIPHPLMRERPFVMIPLQEIIDDDDIKNELIL